MLISERLANLLKMMQNISEEFEEINPVARRMLAIGLITEMHQIVSELGDINSRLDTTLSIEDATLDPSAWISWRFDRNILLSEKLFADETSKDTIINHVIDFFPMDHEDYAFTQERADRFKTGMRQINSNAILDSRSIAFAFNKGIGDILSLLHSIKEKKRKIEPYQYEDFWSEFLLRDDDLYIERATNDYEEWKDSHDWNDIQVLKDKRTQEILKLLTSGVFSYYPVVNRDMQNCIITIPEDALESGTTIPENVDIECARMSKHIEMKEEILCLNSLSLGKYIYMHLHEISEEQGNALIYFTFLLNLIHEDMSTCKPELKQYLSWHDEDEQNEVLEYAQRIVGSCQNLLKEGVSEDFLKEYIHAAYLEGDAKIEVQSKLGRNSKKHKLICQMLGMLKTTLKVFRTDVTSSDIEKSLREELSSFTPKTLQRYINDGAGDHNSKLSQWTTQYVHDKLGSDVERLFLKISR